MTGASGLETWYKETVAPILASKCDGSLSGNPGSMTADPLEA